MTKGIEAQTIKSGNQNKIKYFKIIVEESVGEAGALYICSRKYEICSTEHKEVSVSLICSHKLSCSFFPVSQRSTRSMPCRNYGAGKLYHEVVILVMNPGIKRSSSKGHWQASKKICLYHRLFCLRGYLSISITHFHLSPFFIKIFEFVSPASS